MQALMMAKCRDSDMRRHIVLQVAEHLFPTNPHIVLSDTTFKPQKFCAWEQCYFPDGTEFKAGIGAIRKCSVCPKRDDNGALYACVCVFSNYTPNLLPNLPSGNYVSGAFQERKCWHFRFHGNFDTFIEDSTLDRRFRAMQVASDFFSDNPDGIRSEDERVIFENGFNSDSFPTKSEMEEDGSTLCYSEQEEQDLSTLCYNTPISSPSSSPPCSLAL